MLEAKEKILSDDAHQSYRMAFGQMITELFTLVSVVNRTQHKINKEGVKNSEHQIDMTRLLVFERFEEVKKLVKLPPPRAGRCT